LGFFLPQIYFIFISLRDNVSYLFQIGIVMQKQQTYKRIDYAFSDFLAEKSNFKAEERNRFKIIINQLSSAKNQGHSQFILSDEEKLIVKASGLVDQTGMKPLVLENNALYLQRYWQYECDLATKIQVLTNQSVSELDTRELLDQYFPEMAEKQKDWQKVAANAAITHSFTIITGGPGTGKTTTVVKILGLLQELATPNELNIALVAPTGKAAMRLKESIIQSKLKLHCPSKILNIIPDDVITIHRLLGSQRFSPYFKYNKNHKLAFDLIVVDEASMIDLPLMSKLVSALKDNARLILLGDKDQLASVETGTVLADLSAALPKYTQELKKSYRFSGAIKQLAIEINKQNAEQAWQVILEASDEVSLLETELIKYIVDKQVKYLHLIESNADFIDIYNAFNEFQVLCATRKGVYSVDDINTRVANTLKEANKIASTGEWYIGRPILITQNNPALNLYNGDIGICLSDEANNGQLIVSFLSADGSVKKYFPARLPNCETVFAMTIHKSQGSEFDEVLLVLPEMDSAILTKELIYTAVTRAKNKAKLVAKKNIFIDAINKKVDRQSGLIKRLS